MIVKYAISAEYEIYLEIYNIYEIYMESEIGVVFIIKIFLKESRSYWMEKVLSSWYSVQIISYICFKYTHCAGVYPETSSSPSISMQCIQ